MIGFSGLIAIFSLCHSRVRFESVETFRRWHCHTQSATIRFVRVLAAGFAALRAFPSKAALSSAHFRPASLDLGLAFRWPISRARRQMRGDRASACDEVACVSENSSWVQQEKTAPATVSLAELASANVVGYQTINSPAANGSMTLRRSHSCTPRRLRQNNQFRAWHRVTR